MIEEIRANVNAEINMLREVSNYYRRLDFASPSEAKLLLVTIDSLKNSIKLLNRSLPEMLSNVSFVKQLSKKQISTNLERISIKDSENNVNVTLGSQDKTAFINELRVSDQLIKRLKKRMVIEEEKKEEFKAVRGYLKISNKLLLPTAQKLIDKGYFKPLSLQLRKANIDILFTTYVAMVLFTSFLAFIISISSALFFLFFDINLSLENIGSLISFYEGDMLSRLLKIILVPIVLPAATFGFLYYYPSTEKKTLERRIDQELPFAAIHMSAISGSGIEPSQIFKIIGMSKEYPFLRKEIRKILNQINLYGYDLVTALNNASRSTPSSKLTELFSGLSTTITSGGSLKEFFEKRSETLLIGYRLEREKYTKVAETFMDIYISVVIAAPMILMILLVMISVTNFDLGFTRAQMTFGIILIISLVNILFLAFLHVRQPSY